MKSLFNFLFGKSPDIFDDKGEVRHQLAKKKWQDWHARYMNSPEYNWKNHTGKKARSKNKTASL